MKLFPRALLVWVPFLVALTGVFGCIYLATQQNYRQTFNDPQIQLAEDGAALLARGGVPAELIDRNAPLVEISESTKLWVGVYDAKGKPLEASAKNHNAPPQPPVGLFDTSTWTWEKVHDFNGMKEMRVTWQDAQGDRQALVMVQAPNGYFVVAGRNMRALEERTQEISHPLLFVWGFTVLATLVAIVLTLSLA